MPGVVFLIIVPTSNFERELLYGSNHDIPQTIAPKCIGTTTSKATTTTFGGNGTHEDGANNNLNINTPENNNAVLRLEVELRDKNAPKYKRTGVAGAHNRGKGFAPSPRNEAAAAIAKRFPVPTAAVGKTPQDNSNALVPLEKIVEELLAKLDIETVTWATDKNGYYHQIMFPLQSGEPCETTLHCLTQLGIGTKLNSSVSVLPCSVTYDGFSLSKITDDIYSDESPEDLSKWNAFVESIKSKLTVKQVVDGVRGGGSISFDYILLIVTADSLAALGLIENNAPNIVAAMLVSPLMGPVMSITFGTIISDKELIRIGFATLALGMTISLIFGFVFGLILGTTEMPWGSVDWPTEEMRGRGNVRSLWMGVLWALTSGTGVAVALLQGSVGPLIGVAISASLLPPVVNCGLFWALACTWLIHPDIKMPYIKGDRHAGSNSTYPFIYSDYLPTEFFINGIVSCLLTVVNVICIFITAIIILKIKEVSAPYTASPDLKRFWETDLRTVRKTNQSTMRHFRDTLRDKLLYQNLEEPRNCALNTALEQALKEAEEDVTFKKVKRMSYSSHEVGELPHRLAKMAGLTSNPKKESSSIDVTGKTAVIGTNSRINSLRNSKAQADLQGLEKLVNMLLEQHAITGGKEITNNSAEKIATLTRLNRKTSTKLNRWRPTSRSAHNFNITDKVVQHGAQNFSKNENSSVTALQELLGNTGNVQHSLLMPTIMESHLGAASTLAIPSINDNEVGTKSNTNNLSNTNIDSTLNKRGLHRQASTSWASSLERTPAAMRNMLHSVTANTAHRLSSGAVIGNNSNVEDLLKLTQNYIE